MDELRVSHNIQESSGTKSHLAITVHLQHHNALSGGAADHVTRAQGMKKGVDVFHATCPNLVLVSLFVTSPLPQPNITHLSHPFPLNQNVESQIATIEK